MAPLMEISEVKAELEKHHSSGFGWALSCCGRDPSEAEEVWRLRTGHFNLQHRLTKSTRITSIIFARESDRATSSTDAGFAAFKTDGGVARPWRPLARRTELPAGRPRSGGPRARRSQSTAAPRPPPPQLFETIDHFGFVLPNSENSTESTAYPGP